MSQSYLWSKQDRLLSYINLLTSLHWCMNEVERQIVCALTEHAIVADIISTSVLVKTLI